MSKTRKFTVPFAFAFAFVTAAAGGAHADKTAADATRADIQKTLGFVPSFVRALPDVAVPGAWAEVKGFELNEQTALPGKIKELIGLAVASQSGSSRSNYMYSRCARTAGASDAEAALAVTMAAQARHWSTYMNGAQLDEAKFRGEIAQMVTNISKAAAAKSPPPAPIAVVDAASARADIKANFGFVPDFLQQFPPEALAGAWLGVKLVEMNPETAIEGKYKSLISLAVSSQIPCRYCLAVDTAFAKLDGATDREVHEAVIMAGLARYWGTLIDGLDIDDKEFRRDVDRLNRGAERAPRVARTSR